MTATATAAVPTLRRARLEARLVAFVVDSVVLLSFALLFLAVAGLQLLIASDFGENDPPDASFNAILAIAMAVIPVWLVFNVALCHWRGQTVGKYVADIKVVREDGRPLGLGVSLARFLLLHPLLFHPLLAPFWALTGAIVLSVTLSSAVLAVALALVILSLAATLLTGGSILLGAKGGAIHERVTATMVVPAAAPTRAPEGAA